MFTSVFTNKYFRIVSFSCFLFITCTRKRTYSEEIEKAESSTRLVFHHLALRIVYTEQGTSCNFIPKISRVPQTNMAGHAQSGLEITFNVFTLVWTLTTQALAILATILDKTHVDTARALVLLLRILIGTKIIRPHPLPQSMLAIVDAQNP